MSAIVVDHSLCKKDGICAAVCPMNLVGRDAEGYPVDSGFLKCIECGHCVAVCPTSAIALRHGEAEPLQPVPVSRPTAAMVDGLLLSRRSIRRFKDKPLGRERVTELLEIGRHAPTAVNSQRLHWLVVDDPIKVQAIAEETMNGLSDELPPPRNREFFAAGNDFLLRNAPTLVAVCAPKEYRWATWDSVVALSHVEMAAVARGIGSCHAGFVVYAAQRHEPLNRMLGVPAGYGIFAALMMGWSQYGYKRIPARKPLSVSWL